MPRVLVNDPRTCAKIGKAMKKHIRTMGMQMTEAQCIELCARMFGYRNHNEVLANLSDTPSLTDMHLPPEELEVRARQYLDHFEQAGFPREFARNVLANLSAGRWLGLGRVLSTMPR